MDAEVVSGDAQGRFKGREPIGIVDIGSNSVRLVVYEGITRSPWVLFNEKVMCGLGRGIASTGRLPEDGVELALETLRRFKALATQSRVVSIHALATAAARDAENGPAFVERAEGILGTPIKVISGEEEARLAALAVIAGMHEAEGLVGDLGGGSLELTKVGGGQPGDGVSLPLGGLRLVEQTNGTVKAVRKLAQRHLAPLELPEGGTFYAVGGTWRAIARLHMERNGYPLHIQQAYELTDPAEFLAELADADMDAILALKGIADVSKARRPLLPVGAILLEEIVAAMKPERIVISGTGVREGYLYDLLGEEGRASDPLISAAADLATLNSRDPEHGRELALWTETALGIFGLEETEEERRARVAACLLTDIAWRANPDYRAAQAMRIISYGAFLGADHQMRLMMGLSIFFRYAGLKAESELPSLSRVATDETMARAKLLGALFRVAYLFSGAQSGIVSRLRWVREPDGPTIVVPDNASELVGHRPENRLSHLNALLSSNIRYVISD